VEVKLYVIPGSHPSMAARLMLEHKGIPYQRTDLMPVISKAALKALRFPGLTVPAMKIDGRRVQGTGAIARELDRIQPEPPLVPADPERRAVVEEAERFGDVDMQEAIRRISWNALGRNRSTLRSYSDGAKLGVPIGLAVKTAAPIVAAAARLNDADDEHVRADLAAIPGMLQRVDDWIAGGVLGGEQLTVADFQVGTCLRLAMTFEDLRPHIEGRPAGDLARRVVPAFPGHTPPVFPAAWLEPLRAESSSVGA
jgi:glutathione S-transferase